MRVTISIKGIRTMNLTRKTSTAHLAFMVSMLIAPTTSALAAGAMIRLSTPELIITHTSEGDYSEFHTKGVQQTLYIKDDDVAMYEESWVTLPPPMVTMMLNAMRAGVTQGMAGQTPEQQDDFQMYNLPRVFSERFSWDSVRQYSKDKGTQVTAESVDCPDANIGCTRSTTTTEQGPVQTIYYSDGRPVQVIMPEITFNFEYGNFDIRRPPK